MSRAHGVTASTTGATYTAGFNPQYYFTSAVSPSTAGTIAPGSGWYGAGASFWATATPNTGFQLSSFTLGGVVPSYDVVMNGPVNLTANFVAFTGQTITSNPPGAALVVDMSSLTNNNPGITRCASMAGTWTMTGNTSGGNWTVNQDSPATGNYVAAVICLNGNPTVTGNWPILGGHSSYTPPNQNFAFQAGSGPEISICTGTQILSAIANITGAISAAPMCGMATGNFTDSFYANVAVTLTSTERDPTSETTQFVQWMDQVGESTIGTFQMTLTPSSGVYGGRQVHEQVITYGGTQAGQVPSDSCWFQRAPWSNGDLNQVGQVGLWNVQSQNGNSTYGVDFVGLHPNQVAWMRQYDPNVNGAQSSSCTIQIPVWLQINVENSTTGAQYNSFTWEMLTYTVGANSYSVQRGGVTASR